MDGCGRIQFHAESDRALFPVDVLCCASMPSADTPPAKRQKASDGSGLVVDAEEVVSFHGLAGSSKEELLAEMENGGIQFHGEFFHQVGTRGRPHLNALPCATIHARDEAIPPPLRIAFRRRRDDQGL